MKRILLVVTAVFMLGALTTFLPVKAHDGEDHSNDAEATMHEEETQSEDSEQSDSAKQYEYTAQPSDSYHVLARKAVQTYGINNNVNLSGAEIVFAETHITQEANSPVLNEGQAVNIAEADVKSAIEAAQALSDEDEAAWDYYVQFVDFNTDAAGQAS